MKLNVSFREQDQKFNTQFSDDNESFNPNMGEFVVLHDGQNGATFIPSVSSDGVISWTNDRDLPNPQPVNIKGEQGERGLQGIQGIQGEKGEKGDPGTNGKDGADGQPGKDGYTPIKGVDYFDGAKGDKGDKGDTGANGKDGTDGYTPIKGKDYFTDADKAEIESYVQSKIEEQLGDIYAALDAIHEMLEELMPKKPTFTIQLVDGGIETCTFEEGMLWSDWCNSTYNTIGAYVENDIWIDLNGRYIRTSDSFEVSAWESITAGETYYA